MLNNNYSEIFKNIIPVAGNMADTTKNWVELRDKQFKEFTSQVAFCIQSAGRAGEFECEIKVIPANYPAWSPLDLMNIGVKYLKELGYQANLVDGYKAIWVKWD